MNELSRHIEILLLTNDCVIVPEFGGFVAHYIPAEYSKDDSSFIPPKRILGFNPQLRLNDSLLALSYVEAYDISYPEAITRIEAEVEQIRQDIEQRGMYEFLGIGNIFRASDGHYEFEPCTAGLLTPAVYALSSFNMSEVQPSAVSAPIQAAPVKQEKEVASVLTEAPVAIENNKEAEDEDDYYDDEDEEREPGFYITYKKLWYTAIAALLLLLLPLAYSSLPVGRGSSGVIKCSVGDTGVEVASKIGRYINEQMPVQQEGALTKQTNDSIAKQPNDTINKEKEEQAEEFAEKKTSSFYTIILASYVSKRGANNCVASLARKGLSKASVYETTAMRRVIYGEYASKAEADKELKKLREKDNIFNDTWVQKINRK